MEDKVRVRRVRLADYRAELLGTCSIADDLFSVLDQMKEDQRVGFEVTFPFGCPVVEKGEMILQKLGPVKSFWPDLPHPPEQVIWEDSVEDKSADEVFTAFTASCSRSTDHPLAVILENEVEVYSWRDIDHHLSGIGVLNEQRKYFPLEHLSRGQLLGLFGISDMIEASLRGGDTRPDKGQPWSAVAGRRCVSLEVPKPLPQLAPSSYRESFVELFPTAKQTMVEVGEAKLNRRPSLKLYGDVVGKKGVDGKASPEKSKAIVKHMEEVVYSSLCQIVRGGLKSDTVGNGVAVATTTRMLIIPDYYVGIVAGDPQPLVHAKIGLQRSLLAGAWHQSEGLRDSAWKQGLITSGSDDIEGHHARSVLNHILDVIENRAFVIRPVTENDGMLFHAWRVLCERWSRHRLWDDTCFPLMVTYSRGVPEGGVPALVLPLMLPLNSLSIDVVDIKEVQNQADEIIAVVQQYAEGNCSIEINCEFCSGHEEALNSFMELWKQIDGTRQVGTQMRNGRERAIRVVDGRVRTAKGGNLKSYQSGAFILRRR